MRGLWVGVSGAKALQKRVDTIANNVANANTPGFKRDQQVFREYLTTFHNQSPDIDLPIKPFSPEDFYRTQGAELAYTQSDGSFTDFGQGTMRPTGNPLDLALKGQGLFEVLAPTGLRYTRKGNFSINKEGELTTDTGLKVLMAINKNLLNESEGSLEARPPTPKDRVINLQNGPISINLEGQIFQNGGRIGQLSIVEFHDPHALKKEGAALFVNTDNKNIAKSQTKSTVHQGMLEESNVNPVLEMSALIKAHRNFEAIQQVIKAYDQISQKSANEITRF